MYSTWPVHLSASVHQCSSLLHSDLTVLQQLVQVGFVILWAVVRGAIQWVSYLHLLDLFHLGGKGCWWRKKILVFLNKADFAFSSQTLAIELHYGKCKSECFSQLYPYQGLTCGISWPLLLHFWCCFFQICLNCAELFLSFKRQCFSAYSPPGWCTHHGWIPPQTDVQRQCSSHLCWNTRSSCPVEQKTHNTNAELRRRKTLQTNCKCKRRFE